MAPSRSRTAGALLVSAALLTGCGSSGGSAADSPTAASSSSTATPTTSRTPSAGQSSLSAPQARQEWKAATSRLAKKITGHYSWQVRAEGVEEPLTQESGVYGLAPIRSNFTRILVNPEPSPGDAAKYSVHMRRLGHVSYMQMDDWGTWEGCWLRFTAGDIADQTGIDISGSPDLPVGVLVPLDATVTGTAGSWLGPPYQEYAAQVTGAEAVQFLGVTAKLLVDHVAELQRVKAPITVSIDAEGRVHGARVEGPAVVAALRTANVDLGADVMSFTAAVSATVELSAFGTEAAVSAPPSSQLLPDQATKDQTCPANR